MLKGKKAGDDDISNHLNALMETRREIAEERKSLNMKEIEELKVTEQRKVAAEERRATAEERRAAAEELKAANDSKKIAMEEAHRAMEQERHVMFMDTTSMTEKQKAYVEMLQDDVLRKKQQANAMGNLMGGYMGGMGGVAGGFGGGMGGMGAV